MTIPKISEPHTQYTQYTVDRTYHTKNGIQKMYGRKVLPISTHCQEFLFRVWGGPYPPWSNITHPAEVVWYSRQVWVLFVAASDDPQSRWYLMSHLDESKFCREMRQFRKPVCTNTWHTFFFHRDLSGLSENVHIEERSSWKSLIA